MSASHEYLKDNWQLMTSLNYLNLGFRASFNPSPIKFNPSTVKNIEMPGKNAIHHACLRNLWALLSIKPQLIKLGSPNPRKLTPASIRIAEPTNSVVFTMIGAIALGRISLNKICASEAPSDLDASTNSRSFKDKNSALTNRAVPGHANMPMTKMIFHIFGRKMVTRINIKKNIGIT